MTTAPLISIVIPVRNDARRLGQCLASIAANGSSQHEVVVADNGSVDDSAVVARAAGAEVVTLPGVAVAQLRNRAAFLARGELLAFVDADHLVAPSWIAAAVELLRDQTIAAAGAHYTSPSDANWVQRAYDRFRPKQQGRHDTDWLGSGNLLIRRSVFASVGGFDESLETCEDVDLCNRLRLQGHRLVADDRLASVHQGDPASVRAVFLGELWRGRNNIKVTLRGPWTLRALPSLLIPVFNLGCIALAALGLVSFLWVGPWLALTGVVGLVLTSALRLVRMASAKSVSSASELLETAVVGSTYEMARALALVFRATHKTRREAARA